MILSGEFETESMKKKAKVAKSFCQKLHMYGTNP